MTALGAVNAGCRATPPRIWDPSAGEGRPPQIVLPVQGRPQARSLSCESRSACDLLVWYGIQVSEGEFFAGLPVSDNPELGFVGRVDDPGEGLPPQGYGVYEEPVAARLRALGLPVQTSRGQDPAWLRDQVATGRPVLIWATSRLDAPPTLRLSDGMGRSFPAARGEHTFLVVGYDAGGFVLLDPAQGETKAVSEGRFLRSWSVLGRRAIHPVSAPVGGCRAR